MIEELVKGNRSYRRFHQEVAVSRETLKSLVNLARLSASAANLQPLKYILSGEAEKNAAIFSCLAWAGYLKDWPGPAEGERPAAYIVILGDTEISKNFGCDHGIAAQTILLGARAQGLGGCMLGSIQRDRLRELLQIPQKLDILLVIALGLPTETVVLEEVGEGGSIMYWRDAQGAHHVPKRRLEEIIIG
jgi:nitroreductase